MTAGWLQIGRKGRWICHAAGAETIAIGALAVLVIQASCLTALKAGVGGTQLLGANSGATLGSAVALAAITMPAEEEASLTIGGATAEFEQDNGFCMARIRHVAAVRPLDKSQPFLSL